MWLPERSSQSRMVSADAFGVVTRRIYKDDVSQRRGNLRAGQGKAVGGNPRRKHEVEARWQFSRGRAPGNGYEHENNVLHACSRAYKLLHRDRSPSERGRKVERVQGHPPEMVPKPPFCAHTSMANRPTFGRSVHETWSTQPPVWPRNIQPNRDDCETGGRCDNAIE